MVAILPHGVLFRGAAEGKIRRRLIDNNLIDAVIGLPEKLFDVTSIPVCIMILKKNRKNKDILFIDASSEFKKGKNKNFLTDDTVAKIYETYQKREFVDKYANDVDLDEIKENDYNLNIPRYVDTFEPEPPVDVDKLVKDMKETDKKINQFNTEINGMLNELVGHDEKAQQELDLIKSLF
ncbi:hypothetical protein BGL41_04630 [Fructilactobacillus sanfranciscensis]|nr:hypothetical protein BGL41_04630 [Fructilactobacillus sanfranciscensis]